MLFFYYVAFFILGTIVGSFLNVLILRHNTGLGLIKGSFCFSCGKRLGILNLIPLFSYVAQRGRCASCGTKISPQYFLVEFFTGALFLSIFYAFGEEMLRNSFNAPAFLISLGETLYFCLIGSVLLAIVVYDLKHKIIPDSFVFVFIILALGKVLLPGLYVGLEWENLGYALLAGPFAAAPFVALWAISRGRWMGLGDGKLAWGIGWFLGMGASYVSFLLAFWAGAIVGIFLIAAHKIRLFKEGERFTIKSEIPFAPFLILGAWIVFLFHLNFFHLMELLAFL